jgi:hypothetical protein
MRRLALSALMLSPVMLHAQANLSTGVPALLHAAATAGAKNAGSDAANTAVSPDKIQMVITTDAAGTQAIADRDAGANGQFSFGQTAASFDAPKLVHWTPIQCTETDLDVAGESPDKLVISMVISETGEPTNIKVLQPVNPVLEHKAVAALSQYRFAPAMMEHRPAATPVTVAINFPTR